LKISEKLEILSQNIGATVYLVELVEDYFSQRWLECWSTSSGWKYSRKVSAGVPEGSVIRPSLWNIMHDGLLRIQLPEEAQLTAIADDVAVLITAKFLPTFEETVEKTLWRVKNWLDDHGLELATHKAEAMFFIRKRTQECWK
jgi:hypothetical protein